MNWFRNGAAGRSHWQPEMRANLLQEVEPKFSPADDISDMRKASRHAYYALLLLMLANFLNYVDRSIISIVAEHLKKDLRLNDEQLGFLMGTAFAVFYGVAGISMGRIADALSRTKLMAAALVIWSGLTAASGAATSFLWLAAARVGIGLGESAASPCSQALISDYFPPRNRAAAISLYLIGVYVGNAASLVLGALVLQNWSTLCSFFPGNACGVPEWRAAFFAVGAPGLLLALLVYRLREPPRAVPPVKMSVTRIIMREISAAMPPFTLLNLANAGGNRAVCANVLLILTIVAIGWGLVLATGDVAQWIAVGIGAYSILTWGQVIKLRDRPLYDVTFGSRVFVCVMLAGALNACISAGIGAWSPPYAMRAFGSPPVDTGLYIGLFHALGAGISVPLGGWLSDKWRRRDVRAPVWIGLIGMICSIPFLVLMLLSRDLLSFSLASFFQVFFAFAWSGAAAALAQDLVHPRMRGSAAACFTLVMIVISSGLGPYAVGKVSGITASLASGLLSTLLVVPAAIALFLIAAASLPRAR